MSLHQKVNRLIDEPADYTWVNEVSKEARKHERSRIIRQGMLWACVVLAWVVFGFILTLACVK